MDLNKIYDVTCKTLTISREDFISNPKYIGIRERTIKRYNLLQDLKRNIIVRRKGSLLEKCIKEEFGIFNYNEQTEYKYFDRRLNELLEINDTIDAQTLMIYMTKNKKERAITQETLRQTRDNKNKAIINDMYDKVFFMEGINKAELLDFKNQSLDFERKEIVSIHKNLEVLRNQFDKPESEVMKKIKDNMDKDGINFNFKNFLDYILRNAIRYNEIKKTFGTNVVNPTEVKGMFSLVYSSDRVKEAYNCTKKDNIREVLDTYNRQKNNSEFLNLFNKTDNNGITIGMIIKLSNDIDNVNDLNKYLGIFEKQSIDNYLFYNEEKINELKQKAILKFNKKILTTNPRRFYEFLENNSLYNRLTDEDKEIVRKDNRLFEEVSEMSQKTVNKDISVSNTINDTITSFIELYVIGMKYNISTLNREDYYTNKDRYKTLLSAIETYELDVDIKKMNARIREEEERRRKETEELNRINNEFYQQMEELQRKQMQRMAVDMKRTFDEFDEYDRQERYKDWFNSTFKEIQAEHEGIDFDKLINTFSSILRKVESLTGKDYDPETELITKAMLYNFYNMTEAEKQEYLDNLDIESLNSGNKQY